MNKRQLIEKIRKHETIRTSIESGRPAFVYLIDTETDYRFGKNDFQLGPNLYLTLGKNDTGLNETLVCEFITENNKVRCEWNSLGVWCLSKIESEC